MSVPASRLNAGSTGLWTGQVTLPGTNEMVGQDDPRLIAINNQQYMDQLAQNAPDMLSDILAAQQNDPTLAALPISRQMDRIRQQGGSVGPLGSTGTAAAPAAPAANPPTLAPAAPAAESLSLGTRQQTAPVGASPVAAAAVAPIAQQLQTAMANPAVANDALALSRMALPAAAPQNTAMMAMGAPAVPSLADAARAQQQQQVVQQQAAQQQAVQQQAAQQQAMQEQGVPPWQQGRAMRSAVGGNQGAVGNQWWSPGDAVTKVPPWGPGHPLWAQHMGGAQQAPQQQAPWQGRAMRRAVGNPWQGNTPWQGNGPNYGPFNGGQLPNNPGQFQAQQPLANPVGMRNAPIPSVPGLEGLSGNKPARYASGSYG